jgi:iron complex outermembrane receptor protein
MRAACCGLLCIVAASVSAADAQPGAAPSPATPPSASSASPAAPPAPGAGAANTGASSGDGLGLVAAGDAKPDNLKGLGLEQLMDLEVTTVSKHPQKLATAPSAIQVITNDDIRQSGATTLTEALRLAPNLEVAQANSSQWAISARGFNQVISDKLLVMIDGRSVYTPLYDGVFWDVQNVMLEDVDRVEVVSGPGGTLWGDNAVDGVINVITKGAQDTQGLYASEGLGTATKDSGSIRYGGAAGDDVYYRVYGERFDKSSDIGRNGESAHDGWFMNQGGFRADWDPGDADIITFQGDLYDGHPDPGGGTPVTAQGGNLLARWKQPLPGDSDIQVQGYYDWTWRDFNNGFTERDVTYSIEAQHRFHLGSRNEVTWGGELRLTDDSEADLPDFGLTPSQRFMQLYSAFAQDEIIVLKDLLKVTLGSKFEHNVYTGFDEEPSGRFALTPDKRDTIWGAVSRADRTPSRLDTDFAVKLTPTLVAIQGNPGFQNEEVTAYELGWRNQPLDGYSLQLSTYYNRYHDIRSSTPGPPPFGLPITFGNAVVGSSYGAEFAASGQVTDWMSVRGGYTFLKKHMEVKQGYIDANHGTDGTDDPENQALLQVSVAATKDIDLGAVARYVSALPTPYVAAYCALDLRVAYRPLKHVECAVVGQNLLQKNTEEFAPSSPAPAQVPRSVYGTVAVRW